MPETTELKCCPHCDDRSEKALDQVRLTDYPDVYGTSIDFSVYCNYCNMCGPIACDKITAIDFWNSLPRHEANKQ